MHVKDSQYYGVIFLSCPLAGGKYTKRDLCPFIAFHYSQCQHVCVCYVLSAHFMLFAMAKDMPKKVLNFQTLKVVAKCYKTKVHITASFDELNVGASHQLERAALSISIITYAHTQNKYNLLLQTKVIKISLSL